MLYIFSMSTGFLFAASHVKLVGVAMLLSGGSMVHGIRTRLQNLFGNDVLNRRRVVSPVWFWNPWVLQWLQQV